MALIAKAIMEPTSETVAGRMSVLVVLANSPNLVWRHLLQGSSRILFCRTRKHGHRQGHRHRERTICPFTQGDGRTVN
jgi:hypothetical protein